MSGGKILVADNDGNYLLRLIGEVRVTLCLSLDNYIQTLFKGEKPKTVTVDIRQAKTIDSTTLGLLTRMAQRIHKSSPLYMICDDTDMRRLVCSMGIHYLYNIVKDATQCQQNLVSRCTELKIQQGTQEEVARHVIDAHKSLMALNDDNKEAFKDLVDALERDMS